MVSKCANPNCSTPFHYLRDGKVFQVAIVAPGKEKRVGEGRSTSQQSTHVEYYWLCGTCAATSTLIVTAEQTVSVVPIVRVQHAAAS